MRTDFKSVYIDTALFIYLIEDNPKFIKRNEAAIIKLQPIKKLCLERYDTIPELGRFAIRDMGRTVAVGIVKDIVPE